MTFEIYLVFAFTVVITVYGHFNERCMYMCIHCCWIIIILSVGKKNNLKIIKSVKTEFVLDNYVSGS